MAGDLADTVERIKPSIVAVGTYERTHVPPADFRGTGFAVGDGLHVLTNAHVLPESLNRDRFETLAVFVREGKNETVRQAASVAVDGDHDIALLRIGGAPLPALRLKEAGRVREGEEYAFTGYPLGMVLGLFPVTHRGIVSAISPAAIPAYDARHLPVNMIRRLGGLFDVYQLDATAYPGNSGSPLYDGGSGEVIGILNKVFVQDTKENLLERPSGISYAIPVRHAAELLRKNGSR